MKLWGIPQDWAYSIHKNSFLILANDQNMLLHRGMLLFSLQKHTNAHLNAVNILFIYVNGVFLK